MPIRIAIVENDRLFADTLQLTLNNAGDDLACPAVFYKSDDALTQLPLVKPEIVLMDIDLGQGQVNGIDCIARLQSQLPTTQFMILTVYEDHEKVFDALAAGALGYVLKSAAPEKIIAAIRELHEGGSPMSPSIARKIAGSFDKKNTRPVPKSELLSAREQEVIALISRGKMEKEVAAELFISLKTVKTHIGNIYQKLQVRTRVEALNKYFGR